MADDDDYYEQYSNSSSDGEDVDVSILKKKKSLFLIGEKCRTCISSHSAITRPNSLDQATLPEIASSFEVLKLSISIRF